MIDSTNYVSGHSGDDGSCKDESSEDIFDMVRLKYFLMMAFMYHGTLIFAGLFLLELKIQLMMVQIWP